MKAALKPGPDHTRETTAGAKLPPFLLGPSGEGHFGLRLAREALSVQIETGKVDKPSPNILYRLAELYITEAAPLS
jgi:hypothetical protein